MELHTYLDISKNTCITLEVVTYRLRLLLEL